MSEQQESTEKKDVIMQEITVQGNRLVERLREIIERGNARHIKIQREGRTIMEFPLSVGVGGTAAAVLLSPTLAALGAVGALVSDVKVIIERMPEGEGSSSEEASKPVETGSPS